MTDFVKKLALKKAQAPKTIDITAIQQAEIAGLSESTWDRTGLSFINVAPGSKQEFSFLYTGKKKITNVKGTCGCTTTLITGNKVTGVLTIDKDFSKTSTLTAQVSKTITVTYDDNTTQTLTLGVTVNKNFKIT